jgi:hypothetical protein
MPFIRSIRVIRGHGLEDLNMNTSGFTVYLELGQKLVRGWNSYPHRHRGFPSVKGNQALGAEPKAKGKARGVQPDSRRILNRKIGEFGKRVEWTSPRSSRPSC